MREFLVSWKFLPRLFWILPSWFVVTPSLPRIVVNFQAWRRAYQCEKFGDQDLKCIFNTGTRAQYGLSRKLVASFIYVLPNDQHEHLVTMPGYFMHRSQTESINTLLAMHLMISYFIDHPRALSHHLSYPPSILIAFSHRA